MLMMGFEPKRLAAQEPKSCMSANSITSANVSIAGNKTFLYLFHYD